MRLVVWPAAVVCAAAALTGCHAQPSVSASPNADLVDGQEITVRGGGYSANSTIGVIECPTAADSLDDCDSTTAKTLSTDAQGHFDTTMVVERVITDGHSVHTDCVTANACVVASVYVHGFQGLATAPLAFENG